MQGKAPAVTKRAVHIFDRNLNLVHVQTLAPVLKISRGEVATGRSDAVLLTSSQASYWPRAGPSSLSTSSCTQQCYSHFHIILRTARSVHGWLDGGGRFRGCDGVV